MDRSETLARDHLVFRGYSDPVFEPDGNVPPDFLINGTIAVEVRRLNENERDIPAPKGLEETEIPFIQRVQRLAQSFGPASPQAWWLGLSYKRPLPPWKQLSEAIRRFLEDVKDSSHSSRMAYQIHDNVEIEAIRREGSDGDMFHLAIMSDEDSGGWVLEELERNLRLIIDDKTAKIQTRRQKYQEWWLLLLDQVSYGLSEFDRAQFMSTVHIEHSWDRIILVNPLDYTHYFEI